MSIVGVIVYGGVGTPVIWANASSSPTPLTFLTGGGTQGSANGINSLGQIVGIIIYAGVITPVIWANATASPTPLTFLTGGGTDGAAIGINSLGQIVGYILYAGVETPVIWANASSSPTPLTFLTGGGTDGKANGINSLGQIVGYITYASIQTPVIWTNASSSPTPLTFLTGGGTDGKANGINSLGQIVGSIAYGGVGTPVIWANASSSPTPLTFIGGSLGFAYGIQDPPEAEPTPAPISNICFPAGTPIKTDQGLVNIEFLDERTHTIAQKSILHITKTTTVDKYLIRFAQNALGRNVPDKKTIMTKDHQIMFEGRLVPAYRFLDFSEQVKKVKYSGETLYNVLLKEHGLMNVNNLLCETLHPDNIIAKLYLTNYSDEERSSIVYQMNTALLNNDVLTYKAVVDRLTLML